MVIFLVFGSNLPGLHNVSKNKRSPADAVCILGGEPKSSSSQGPQSATHIDIPHVRSWEELGAYIQNQIITVRDRLALKGWIHKLESFLNPDSATGRLESCTILPSPAVVPVKRDKDGTGIQHIVTKKDLPQEFKAEYGDGLGAVTHVAPVIAKRPRGRPRKDSLVPKLESSSSITNYFSRVEITPSPCSTGEAGI